MPAAPVDSVLPCIGHDHVQHQLAGQCSHTGARRHASRLIAATQRQQCTAKLWQPENVRRRQGAGGGRQGRKVSSSQARPQHAAAGVAGDCTWCLHADQWQHVCECCVSARNGCMQPTPALRTHLLLLRVCGLQRLRKLAQERGVLLTCGGRLLLVGWQVCKAEHAVQQALGGLVSLEAVESPHASGGLLRLRGWVWCCASDNNRAPSLADPVYEAAAGNKLGGAGGCCSSRRRESGEPRTQLEPGALSARR